MKSTIHRPAVLAAGFIAFASATASFPSHAFLGMSSGKCNSAQGSLRIVEPDDGMGVWATYGLPAPTRMLRVLVNDSKCFTVLDRGAGFTAAQAERELAMGGHLQEDQNIGGGQMRGADFVLVPDIVSQNANAGGMSLGGGASNGGNKRGLMGAMFNVATLGVAGKLTTKKQTAEVVLTLVDVRTSEQLISVTGEAKITDKAWAAAVSASNLQGSAGVNVGSWDNTEIGKVIKEAYEEAYERMVDEIGNKRGALANRHVPQATRAATPIAPPDAYQTLAASQARLANAAAARLQAGSAAPQARHAETGNGYAMDGMSQQGGMAGQAVQHLAGQGVGAGLAQAAMGAMAGQDGMVGAASQVAQQVAGQGIGAGVAQAAMGVMAQQGGMAGVAGQVVQQVAGQGVGAGVAQAAMGLMAQQGGMVGAAGQVAQQVAGQGVGAGVAQAAMGLAAQQGGMLGAAGQVAQQVAGQSGNAGTMMLHRMARLLSQPDSQATVVAELKPGMLAYPTGGRNGGMIEVDDEMGNRGWLPSAVLGTKQ
ncbi:CsgG/HfaB family protein [Stenotrophomonas humi]|uniref:CsgG/HfaB family protein n=1 Tax=Stenotrophomonas humi TaxID=405444 RepID=UPI0009FA03A6|nr:CsgG/HfaB family protein [Stenotrophomonas humi]